MSQRADCADCAWYHSGPVQPYYDHIHQAQRLPRARYSKDHIIALGHAVGMAGPRHPQTWTFFTDVEPALAFGRAGRMAADISSYGVYPAAQDIRFDRWTGSDVVVLLIGPEPSLGRQNDEPALLQRWVQGCHPSSAHFRPSR